MGGFFIGKWGCIWDSVFYLMFMERETVFTKIIKRKIPAFIVAEDKDHIAFLDINPVVVGHTLVVPKKVTDYFFDIADDALGALMCFSKRVAGGIKQVVSCLRVGVKVHGLEVPHAHIHLIPILGQESDDVGGRVCQISMEDLAQRLSEVLRSV